MQYLFDWLTNYGNCNVFVMEIHPFFTFVVLGIGMMLVRNGRLHRYRAIRCSNGETGKNRSVN